jgi:hypothetical protein
MSIFPFVESDVVDVGLNEINLPIPKEWAWDFESNDFLFKNNKPYLVEGLEAVKIWAYKALSTERFKHEVYSWDYGSEINSLIGSGYSRAAVESEVPRLIWEALQSNPYIISTNDLNINFDGDSLSIELTIETIFGDMEVITSAN